MQVRNNLQRIQEQMKQSCEKANREMKDLTVIAVTKYVDLDRMKEAFEAGLEHIGESKVQDAKGKWEALNGQGIWHFIGHLQTNKVKDMIDKFAYIHSLDRISLAKEIEKRASVLGKIVDCFVQVNISGEDTKHGLSPNEVEKFILELKSYPHVRAIGLMTMAPYEEEPEKTRPIFRQLKELQLNLQRNKFDHAPLTELSMGMSNDFHIAIEEGATFVRLGSSLVGE